MKEHPKSTQNPLQDLQKEIAMQNKHQKNSLVTPVSVEVETARPDEGVFYYLYISKRWKLSGNLVTWLRMDEEGRKVLATIYPVNLKPGIEAWLIVTNESENQQTLEEKEIVFSLKAAILRGEDKVQQNLEKRTSNIEANASVEVH